MHLQRRGWEGLTKHQKKWGGNRNRKKKISWRVLQFDLVPALLQVLQVQCLEDFSNTHSWPKSLSLVFTPWVPLSMQGPKPTPDQEDLTQLRAIKQQLSLPLQLLLSQRILREILSFKALIPLCVTARGLSSQTLQGKGWSEMNKLAVWGTWGPMEAKECSRAEVEHLH